MRSYLMLRFAQDSRSALRTVSCVTLLRSFMSTRADQAIAALRKGHDDLSAFVAGLTAEQLTGPSAADEWDVSQVVSHLGSGAEINLEAVQASIEGRPAPEFEFNKGVWARWDGMTPQERQAAFPAANQRLVEAYEAFTPQERET